MKCKFCGLDMPEEATVCPFCGTPVHSSEENQIPEQKETTDEGKEAGNEQLHGGTYSYQQDFEQKYNHTYHQNNGQYQNPGMYNMNYPGQEMKPVNSTPYMIFAVFTTLMCCLPFGIAAIVYASRINSLQRMGDFAGASQAAKKAKTFSIISAVMTLIVMIAYGVLFVALPDDLDFESGVKNTEIYFPGADETDTDKKETDKTSGGLEGSWDSYTVLLGDSVLKLPGKPQDIEAAGFKIDEDTNVDDYVIDPHKIKSVFVKNNKGVSIKIDLLNDTNEIQKIADCKVSGVYVDEYSVENEDFSIAFPGGIGIGTSEKELLDTYGKVMEHYEGELGHSYVWYNGDDYSKKCQIEVVAKKVIWMGMQYTN